MRLTIIIVVLLAALGAVGYFSFRQSAPDYSAAGQQEPPAAAASQQRPNTPEQNMFSGVKTAPVQAKTMAALPDSVRTEFFRCFSSLQGKTKDETFSSLEALAESYGKLAGDVSDEETLSSTKTIKLPSGELQQLRLSQDVSMDGKAYIKMQLFDALGDELVPVELPDQDAINPSMHLVEEYLSKGVLTKNKEKIQITYMNGSVAGIEKEDGRVTQLRISGTQGYFDCSAGTETSQCQCRY